MTKKIINVIQLNMRKFGLILGLVCLIVVSGIPNSRFEGVDVYANIQPQSIPGWTQLTQSGNPVFNSDVETNVWSISSTRSSSGTFQRRFTGLRPNTEYRISVEVYSSAVATPANTPAVMLTYTVNNVAHGASYDATVGNSSGGWQTLVVTMRTNNNTSVFVNLRHGTPSNWVGWGRATGITHFRNFRFEAAGDQSTGTEWNFLGLVIRNIDLHWVGTRVQSSMTNQEANQAVEILGQGIDAIVEMSGGGMTANLTTTVIDAPVTRMSSAIVGDPINDIVPIISSNVIRQLATQAGHNILDYDKVFAMVMMRTGPFAGLPYSGVYTRDGTSKTIFYEPWNNVFDGGLSWTVGTVVHEFLHHLEDVSLRRGVPRPYIHDWARYSYDRIGFYQDFMRNQVLRAGGGTYGMTAEVYARFNWIPIYYRTSNNDDYNHLWQPPRPWYSFFQDLTTTQWIIAGVGGLALVSVVIFIFVIMNRTRRT